MEIKRSGSTLAVILGSGGWTAAGFRAYLSLQEDEEAALKALLTSIENGGDSDSGNESANHPSSSGPKRGRLTDQ